MPRYVVVLPVEPLVEGDAFRVSEWPLHVTVVPNFRTDASVEQVVGAVRSTVVEQKVIAVVAAEAALFGPESNIEVALLADPAPLRALHGELSDSLEAVGISPEVPDYWGAGFTPHITATPARRAAPGERFELSQLALVDMSPEGDDEARAVVATVPIG